MQSVSPRETGTGPRVQLMQRSAATGRNQCACHPQMCCQFTAETRGRRPRPVSGTELRREILKAGGDVGEVVLGLEVAALLRAVLVGAGDIGGSHAMPGGID